MFSCGAVATPVREYPLNRRLNRFFVAVKRKICFFQELNPSCLAHNQLLYRAVPVQITHKEFKIAVGTHKRKTLCAFVVSEREFIIGIQPLYNRNNSYSLGAGIL